ncbi:Condensin-2 complex subunit G2 [Morella rubra]|uniref:Condensin-2 complex subunit G2 n=1 Tax=Morella rubra TaxID=262757 RepID=A0A6A1VTL9_9ROSI|nr:Condensin-2 complex subunit G2 [Morella rubra]
MIRSQIPFGRKSMLEAYGDILFRAWKAVGPDHKDEIEHRFLQGLIEGAIHASSGAFAASIRRVLGGFISQRTTEGVEKLLFSLAEPVIFRSLQVANSNVRQNALHVLLDMFPLEDPDSTKEAKDTLLDKQFFLLERLLMDDCPDVRLVAVEGCCRILHLFWEIIPSASITKIIMKIFDDMSHDICNEVRLSTLNGVIYLLGNPQSHEILKVLLPRLGHLMLDNVSSVRMALVDLLLLLRDMRNFQFNKVVGLDVLLSTLANDQPLVAQKITKLLMPSYFPSKLPVEEACNRCVTLIKRSPIAGARFCEFSLLGGASINSLMELIRVFISLVLSPVKLNADQIEGLLVAAAYLSRSISIEPCFENALKQLLAGEKVKFLFSAASTARAQSSVLNIVSNLASDAAAGVFEECTGLVTNCSGISDNVERQAQLRSAHKLFQSCDGFNDMFEALTVCLQKTAYRCHIKFGTEAPKNCVSSAKRKKSSSGKMSAKWKHVNRKRRSNFEEDYSIAVGIAWQIRDLLVSVDSRKAVLASQTLESSFLALKIISEASILQCVHCEYMDAYPVLAYTALALHMTLQNISINSTKPNALEQTMDHLLNCIEKVLGAVNSGKSGNSSSVFEQANHKTAIHCGQTHREPQMHASSCSADGKEVWMGQNCKDFCTEQKRLPIKVKMLTAILKSMVDATSMGFLSHYYGRFLKFTSGYVQDVVSALRRRSHDRFQFKEEDLKDIVLCLKSSFTYAAKLVNLVNRDISEASSLASEAFDLVNDLLDLVSSIELYLGSGNAASLVSAAKHWLPDLVLALGYGHILKQTRGEGLDFHASCRMKHEFPLWLLILAKSELLEISKFVSEDGEDTVSEFEEVPVSKKLLGMIVTLSKGNPSVLDAVGVMVLTGSLVGLERKDFGLVLGLLHLVCRKLFREDDREWGDMMLASLQDVYPQIEREMEEQNDEDGRQKLHCAKELLEPVWMHHIYETGRVSMTEE